MNLRFHENHARQQTQRRSKPAAHVRSRTASRPHCQEQRTASLLAAWILGDGLMTEEGRVTYPRERRELALGVRCFTEAGRRRYIHTHTHTHTHAPPPASQPSPTPNINSDIVQKLSTIQPIILKNGEGESGTGGGGVGGGRRGHPLSHSQDSFDTVFNCHVSCSVCLQITSPFRFSRHRVLILFFHFPLSV